MSFMASTSEVSRVKAMIKEFRNAIPRGWKRPDDGQAVNAARAATSMLKGTTFTFDSELTKAGYEKNFGKKIQNFRKFLVDMSNVVDADSWREFKLSHSTKSKGVWDKVWEYTELLEGIVSLLSEEVVDSFSHGPWTVVLVQSSGAEWTDDKVSDLLFVLDRSAKEVSGAGFSRVVGGRVMAYPSRYVPRVHGSGVNAFYNRGKDMYALAAGENIQKAVRTMVHEMGHRYYWLAMGGRSRNAWRDFFGENVGLPDVDGMISKWEKWAKDNQDDFWKGKYGRYLGTYLGELSKSDSEDAMWLSMVADAIGISEPSSISGYKKNTVPGLDQLKAKKSEAKVFLYPVTAYSGTSPEELFAETFSYIVIDGPGRVPPIVRGAFGQAVPAFRAASESVIVSGLQKLAKDLMNP